MGNGYNKIFWGLIFITCHINLGSIQILPNFIGYIIIYAGIQSLFEEYKIKSLEQSAKCSSILSFMSFVILGMTFAGSESIINNVFFNLIWMNIFGIVEILMIYKLLDGTSEILKNKENNLQDSFSNKISIYVILSSIVIVGNNINYLFMSKTLVIVTAILALALKVWIIVLNRKMYTSN